MSYDVLIVGAGLSGATIANKYATVEKKKVLVIDKRSHLAGNCYDEIDESTGILKSKYGAHIFHTNDDEVWRFVNKFSVFNDYKHKVLSFVNGLYVPIPVNISTVNILFNLEINDEEEMISWLNKERVHFDHKPKNSRESALSRLGERLYKLMVKDYTYKQWEMYPEDLNASVLDRIPVRTDFNDRYFSDTYEGMPIKGYTELVKNMLDDPLIEVQLDIDYFERKDNFDLFPITYFTGPIDRYFEYEYEPLKYRSLRFEEEIISSETFQPASVVNEPEMERLYTRTVEHNHFYKTNKKNKKTIITREYGTWEGEPYYPVPDSINISQYRKYANLARNEHNTIFVGRLANYKYFNMDQAIRNALDIYNITTK